MRVKILALATALACGGGAAWADSPHFIKGPTASLNTTTGDLTVSFKEAGLGSTPVTYELTAGTEKFTFQCFTRSNNTPQGAPNNVSFSNASTQTTITPHNGQITGSISLEPQKDGASCQGHGLKLCLIAVDYENVTFQDITNHVPSPPASLGTFAATLTKPICE
jgi:hypothetical protein